MAVADACTLWFEGNWSACCVAHDAAYDRGLDKLGADLALFECVRAVAGWPMAVLMLAGVTVGGWYFIRRRSRR